MCGDNDHNFDFELRWDWEEKNRIGVWDELMKLMRFYLYLSWPFLSLTQNQPHLHYCVVLFCF